MDKQKRLTHHKHTAIEPFEGRLGDLVQWAQGLVDQYGPEARLDHSIGSSLIPVLDSIGSSYGDDFVEAEVSWTELETDDEYARRMAKIRDRKKREREKRREKELRELARLQKKYGSEA